jgi:hypothetical protein
MTDWGMMIATCEEERKEIHTQDTCIRNTPTLKRATLWGGLGPKYNNEYPQDQQQSQPYKTYKNHHFYTRDKSSANTFFRTFFMPYLPMIILHNKGPTH